MTLLLRHVMRASCGALAALVLVACTDEVRTPKCRRFDQPSFVADRGYSVLIERADLPRIDDGADRIEVSMFFSQPPKERVELVHVIEGREVGKWPLEVPRSEATFASFATCWIGPRPGASNCGAVIETVPHGLDGYYYLRSGTASLVEAGFAFYLCN